MPIRAYIIDDDVQLVKFSRFQVPLRSPGFLSPKTAANAGKNPHSLRSFHYQRHANMCTNATGRMKKTSSMLLA
jgi:hypothetical protein